MKKAFKGLFVAIFCLCLNWSFAQDKGHITYELTDVASDNPQMAPQLEMMKGSLTEVYYLGQKSLTNMSMMGGMVKINVLMEEIGDVKMFMDIMGQKMLINMSKADLDKQKALGENPMSDLEVTYDLSDTKVIAGYDCYKMKCVSKTNPDMKLEGYITEAIKTNAGLIQGVNVAQFKGFPMEYTVDMGIMKMTTLAKTYTKDVDETVFNINKSGYKEMTLDEFKTQMGGMGGGGFGF